MKTIAVSLLLAFALTGCDWDKDNDSHHKVPDGKGSLIVDNNTADDIAIYIDGSRVKNMGDYRDEAFDLEPGTHRVVLDQRGGDRSFRDDIDILEGKRTTLDVSAKVFDNDYDVVVFFD